MIRPGLRNDSFSESRKHVLILFAKNMHKIKENTVFFWLSKMLVRVSRREDTYFYFYELRSDYAYKLTGECHLK